VLQERAVAGKLAETTRPALLAILHDNADVTRQLRALWALHATGGVSEMLTLELLASSQEQLRSWAIRLSLDSRVPSETVLSRFAQMARDDPSPLVRLALASALQRLPFGQRWAIAEALMAHSEDATDDNLPLMIWYGIDTLMPSDPKRGADLILKAKIPLIREYLARQIAGLNE
jgi:hypothetical protein